MMDFTDDGHYEALPDTGILAAASAHMQSYFNANRVGEWAGPGDGVWFAPYLADMPAGQEHYKVKVWWHATKRAGLDKTDLTARIEVVLVRHRAYLPNLMQPEYVPQPPPPGPTSYAVIVPSEGIIFAGTDKGEAESHYKDAVRQSRDGHSIWCKQAVVFLVDGQTAYYHEHDGTPSTRYNFETPIRSAWGTDVSAVYVQAEGITWNIYDTDDVIINTKSPLIFEPTEAEVREFLTTGKIAGKYE
jgi:hypothetical protein